MPQIWLSIIGLVGAVFLFGFAVFVHELGHFLVAKWCGVGVKKFAIGMGPIIWAITRGGTEYSLRWFPVGGFVSLKGDPADEEAEAEAKAQPKIAGETISETGKASIASLGKDKKPGASADLDALSNQPALKKIAVFVAGITCNYLTAIVLMGFLLWYGIPKSIDLPTMIEKVSENSQLYKLGWRSGDRILAVKSKPVKVWDDVLEDLSKGMNKKTKLGKPMPVTVQRDGTTVTLPSPYAENLSKDELEYFTPALPAFIGAVEPGSPAFRARLISADYNPDQKAPPEPEWDQMRQASLDAGDLIVAVNDQPIHSWHEMESVLHGNPGKPITLVVKRDNKYMKFATVLETNEQKPEQGRLGIYQALPTTNERVREPFYKAVAKAPGMTVALTGFIITETIHVIHEMSWKQTQRNLGGPVVIGIMAYKSAQRGLYYYLNLFIMISITLAIMNLLPIPILDGGYVAISIIEAIIGRPIPRAILVPILTTFMVLLIMAFIFIFYNDFKTWVLKF